MDPGGRTLHNFRSAAGLTQEALADLAQVAVRTVRGIETGRIKSPRIDTLGRLASALDLSAGDRERSSPRGAVDHANRFAATSGARANWPN